MGNDENVNHMDDDDYDCDRGNGFVYGCDCLGDLLDWKWLNDIWSISLCGYNATLWHIQWGIQFF